MNERIWILDDEFDDYEVETALLKQAFPNCKIRCSGRDYQADLETFGSRADAVICQISFKMDAELMGRLACCRILSVYGTGYNNVDVTFAKSRGIHVGFVPGYCAQDIAEYVIGALYACSKRYEGYMPAIRKGLWGAAAAGPLRRLEGQKLLIVGFGRIGRLVAQKALANGLDVLAYDPYLTQEDAKTFGVCQIDWGEGLRLADFVTVHCICNEKTAGLMDYAAFSKMKPTAWLINTSRGGIVKQNDLIRAVNEGKLAGAMLDVLETEPPRPDDPILHTNGILVTPHISYYSAESLWELQYRAAKNVVKVLKNEDGADLVC